MNVLDRRRFLEEQAPGYGEERRDAANFELLLLNKRITLVLWSVALAVLAALLVCLLVGTAFAGAFIAIDLSPKMVDFGRALAEKHNLPNLEYRIGDIEEPPIENDSVDLAFLSQALHHAEHPQKAIDSAYRLLKPGGRLVILDLLLHGFEEARELYADRWLGFSESDLASMLETAGFRNIETVVADKESEAPKFQTLLGVGCK